MDSVSRKTVVHDLQEFFGVVALCGDKEKIVDKPQQQAVATLKEGEMLCFEISIKIITK